MINRKKGFMISELVIGLVFLIMFIFINITLYINSTKNNIESRRFIQATNLLIKKVEQIQGMSFDDLDLSQINIDNEGDYEQEAEGENEEESEEISPLLDEEVTIGTTKYEIKVEGREVPNPNTFRTLSAVKHETYVDENDGKTYDKSYQNYIYYNPIAKIFTVTIMYGPDENKQIYSINTLKIMENDNNEIFSAENSIVDTTEEVNVNYTEIILEEEPID